MPLRLVVFDFDGTLSASHIWNSLSGAGKSPTPLPPPYSRTELGQIAKIVEVDNTNLYGGPGGFAVAVFGGADRLERIHRHLRELHSYNVECVVCSRSLVGPLRKLMEQAGILAYFTQVFGSTGVIAPVSDYDVQNPVQMSAQFAPYVGTEEVRLKDTKGLTIQGMMQARKLRYEEVIFIDDMPQEIQEVCGMCKTLHVEPLKGMGVKEFDYISQLAAKDQGQYGAPQNEYTHYTAPTTSMRSNNGFPENHQQPVVPHAASRSRQNSLSNDPGIFLSDIDLSAENGSHYKRDDSLVMHTCTACGFQTVAHLDSQCQKCGSHQAPPGYGEVLPVRYQQRTQHRTRGLHFGSETVRIDDPTEVDEASDSMLHRCATRVSCY